MLARIPLVLLLWILPLGVAGHNIGTGVIAVLLLLLLWCRRQSLPLASLWQQHRWALVSATAFMLMQVVSTRLNPANPDQTSIHYLFGHIIWAFLPAVVYLGQIPLQDKDWQLLLWAIAVTAVVLGGLAVSQAIWGWKLQQSHIVYGFHRAQGLYSHPMSLAYVGLVFVPAATVLLLRWPGQPATWIIAAGILAVIVASASRTVQAVSVLVMLFNICTGTSGRVRALLLAGLLATITLVLTTPNPISARLHVMLNREDVHGEYIDDRVVFWQANWEMVKERPLLGHGEGLLTSYREPYYAAIGQAGFYRKYEAHNMLLQVAVNGGLIGVLLLLWWFADLWLLAKRAPGQRPESRLAGRILLQTLVAFGLGSLTQNAFQDSAVRYTLTIAVLGLWLACLPATALAPAPRGGSAD